MKPEDRYRWIEREIPRWRFVDVLNRYFVDAYVEVTGAKCYPMPFGADKCPQLGRDLAYMYRVGLLTRHVTGIDGMAGMGFPRWVYTYWLPKKDRPRLKKRNAYENSTHD